MGSHLDSKGRGYNKFEFLFSFWQNEEGLVKCPDDLGKKKEVLYLSPHKNLALINVIPCYRNGGNFIRTQPFIHLSTHFSDTQVFKTASTVSDIKDVEREILSLFPSQIKQKGYSLCNNDMGREPEGGSHGDMIFHKLIRLHVGRKQNHQIQKHPIALVFPSDHP